MQTSDIYIIKITPYRESSNIYDAIAKDFGKITLIHKGIKYNTKSNSLELFCPYKINWSGKIAKILKIVQMPYYWNIKRF